VKIEISAGAKEGRGDRLGLVIGYSEVRELK